MVRTGPATTEEMGQWRALLRSAGLPDEVGDHPGTVSMVATASGTVIGGVALERYGASGLIRSLVVDEAQRATGVGRRLVRELLDLARDHGIVAVYLLTETAPGFFERLGFRTIGRGDAPREVQASSEFAVLCPDSAIAMRTDL